MKIPEEVFVSGPTFKIMNEMSMGDFSQNIVGDNFTNTVG
jgi:hypothetical protein